MVRLLGSSEAHSDKVWSVHSHPTLPLLVSGSTDKTSTIFKLTKDGKFPVIGKLEGTHKRSVRAVQFKPPLGGFEGGSGEVLDLPALAAGSFDSTISIWGIDEPEDVEELLNNDMEEVELIQKQILCSLKNEWNLMAIIEGHENEVKAVAWNYHGNLLATCSRDKTIWIWETDSETLEEFECISVLSDHQHDVKHVIWHPTQNMLASSSYDDTVRLYKQDIDEEDWSCVGVLNGHEGTVWCSSFEHPKSPSASSVGSIRLVSCSDDQTVRIWSCQRQGQEQDGGAQKEEKLPSIMKRSADEMTWEQETILPSVHKYPIYSVAWSPISGRIASSGSDGTIAVYEQSSSGVWSVRSTHELSHGVYEINCVTWCLLEDGTEILATAGDDGCVNFWQD